MPEIDQKSLERLAQVRLEANVLLKDLINEVRLIELEASEVRKVHLHRSLLVLLDCLRLVNVEADWSALYFLSLRVKLVVRVIFLQFEPTQ